MRVKVCGLTRSVDVERAVRLGATHLGFVLAPESPRAVSAGWVGAVVRTLPSHVTPVLVFRDASDHAVLSAARESGVVRVQLHRHRPGQVVRLTAAGLVVHLALDAELVVDLTSLGATLATPVVLDHGGGGSGRSFDWQRLAPQAPEHVFIAGGLTPDNVSELLRFQPWGLDVSSGLERSPGIKDAAKLQAFFRATRANRTGQSGQAVRVSRPGVSS
ncbi:MAG: phosphoribosylanthranilate isomerase [Acidobacteriota bacterium]